MQTYKPQSTGMSP